VSGGLVRIGVLGAAKITPEALIGPSSRSERVEVVAVAARDRERARRFAERHGIQRVEPSYRALIQSPELDAIYNPLPASLHAEWTLEALASGKHVLCEKPFAANASEAEQMVAAAQQGGLVLLEAFHYCYHPLASRMREIVASGALGDIHRVEGVFCVPIPDLEDIRYIPSLGGGATMDLGCYPIHWSRFVIGAEPTVLRAEARQAPPGIDIAMTAELGFPGDIRCEVRCSMAADANLQASLRVTGSRGEMFVGNPLAPHIGHTLAVRTGGDETSERVDGRATYDHQLEAFAAAVLDGEEQPTGGRDAIANMRVIDAVYRAAGMQPRGG